MAIDSERYERGRAKLDSIDPGGSEALIESLAAIAPDLARYVIEFRFGDVYSRPGLDPPRRELVTIGALTAFGGCGPQLRLHVGAGLNVGLTPREIVEAILQVAPYAGFPRVLNAVGVARQVFDRRLLPVAMERG